MWKWLHPYAKPETQYRICGKLSPLFAFLTLILLGVGIVWGLAFAPADYQQGNSFRIMYVHVPTADLVNGSVRFNGDCGCGCPCVGKLSKLNLAMIAMAPIGALFTFLSLVTGAIWGKPMWGTWWVWDARLTAELILFFLYLGILALYSAFSDRNVGAKAAGILCITTVVILPIIHFSVEWWNTLHQGASITKLENHPLQFQCWFH